MEHLIRYGEPDQSKYSCSKYTDEQWYTFGQKWPFVASYLFVSGIVFWVIYALCLIAMVRARLPHDHSCYKIMFVMGCFDLCTITVSSHITGFFLYKGAVYCNYPIFNYVTGGVGIGLWSIACCFCFILSVNRLAELVGWNFGLKLFHGKALYLICFLPVPYGFSISFFTPPLLFYSRIGGWLFDPHNESGLLYVNIPHTVNNLTIAVFATLAYIFICYKVTKASAHQTQGMSIAQKLMYIQAFIICSTHVFASYGFVYMNYFYVPEYLIIFGHIACQWSHGTPGVMYLIMNEQIRGEVWRIVLPWKKQKNLKSSNRIASESGFESEQQRISTLSFVI